MHRLCGDLPVQYVPVRVTRWALVAQRYTYGPTICGTSKHSWTFISFSVYLWNDLADPVFNGVGLADFKSRANVFLALFFIYRFPFLLFLSLSWHCGAGVF